MNISIHVEFMRALGRLASQDRKATEDMILRMQSGGITPGMRRHQIAADGQTFMSLSPSMDIRVLAIENESGVIMLYVDHHDKAYQWAERNQSRLGVVLLLLASDKGPQQIASRVNEQPTTENPLVSRLNRAGFPSAIVKLLSSAVSEDQILDLVQMLAPEWQELIMDTLSSGITSPSPVSPSNVWVAPDDASLRAALALPLSQWRLFLHPSQAEAISAEIDKDLVIVGGPGTGKTVALVHRARRLTELCSEQQKVLLVCHSPQAVAEAKQMLKELIGGDQKNLAVVDMIAIGRDGRPRWGDVAGPSSSQSGYLKHMGDDVLAMLIDESQDVHRTTKSYIFGRRPEVKTHITASVDFNQNIFAKNSESESYLAFLNRARVISLNYSYRIPREAGTLARDLVTLTDNRERDPEPPVVCSLRELSRKMSFGFTSEFIRVYSYANLSNAVRHAKNRKDELESSGVRNIGVVFCGSAADRRRYGSDLELLGYRPEADRGISTARSVKGTEFEYCFVISPELLLRGDQTALHFARNQIYVALSRCRRGLEVYASREFALQLAHPGVELIQCD